MADRQAHTLGIDIGTSGLRIAALGEHGDCLWLEKRDWPAAVFAADGEQEPRIWWQAFDRLMQHLGQQGRLAKLRSIAFSGTSGTVLTLAADDGSQGRALMYDAPHGQERRDSLRALAGNPDTADEGSPDSRIDAQVDAQVDALARWRWLVESRGQSGRPASPVDWFVFRLTGQHVSDSNNMLKWGFDAQRERWPMALAAHFGDALPSVLRAGTPIGPLQAPWWRRWRLPAATLVAAGTTDSMAALWASGASRDGDGVTSLGSTLALKLISDHPVADAASGVYSHRFGDRFAISGASNTGGRVLARYFSGADIKRLSRQIDPDQPDALGYWPLIGRGERFPVVDANMLPRLTPRPADPAAFLAGLLHGIARIEALGYRRFAELGAAPVRQVLTSGGGAHNVVFRTIRARALGVPVMAAEQTEAAVGAARLAAMALGHDQQTGKSS